MLMILRVEVSFFTGKTYPHPYLLFLKNSVILLTHDLSMLKSLLTIN